MPTIEQVLARTDKRGIVRDAARELANRGDMFGVFSTLGYHPTPGQRSFHEARETHRRRVLCTGRRFGKTTAAGMEACYELLRGSEDGGATRTLFLAPTADLSERAFRVVKRVLVQQCRFPVASLHDTPERRDLTMPWGSAAVCASTHGAGIDAVLGDAYDLAILDEAARMPPHVWESDVEPCLADRDGSAIFPSTPKLFGWFYDLWLRTEDPAEPDWWGLRARTEDNPHISRAWLNARRLSCSPEVYRREYEGLFTSYEGNVYPEWDEARHVSEKAEYDPTRPVCVTFDFGTTAASPFVAVLCQWFPEGENSGRLHIFNELVIAGQSTRGCARRLHEWWGQNGYPRGETDTATGDIAAADARQVLYEELDDLAAGILPSGVTTNKQEVEAGIELVRDLLREDRLLVHPRCTTTRAEFGAYTWRSPTREGEPERGVRKTMDHAMDACRYLLWELVAGGRGSFMQGLWDPGATAEPETMSDAEYANFHYAEAIRRARGGY